jgi:RNA polymerase-binding transcription factor DksA
MKESDVSRYKARLLRIRDRARPEIDRMLDVVLGSVETLGEHDHKVSESVDKEVVLENNEEAMRDAVTAALGRIENGTYGTCESCGKSIPLERLDAIPYTPYCVNCERLQESA